MLKEQSNNFCLPHDVLSCDDVLIRFGFLASIRIFLFLLTKTLNSKAERTDVFVRNCKAKIFNQMGFVLIECI